MWSPNPRKSSPSLKGFAREHNLIAGEMGQGETRQNDWKTRGEEQVELFRRANLLKQTKTDFLEVKEEGGILTGETTRT